MPEGKKEQKSQTARKLPAYLSDIVFPPWSVFVCVGVY